ncbi:hypothetical protein PIB30_020210 [Stylosanthes scabra]|uniref:Uncharacterized protein n=1 Tax=Stylosanthes scabra TaxID=79078 RepID=A0ABU6S8F6_9FABA|nr:hypothetical protein [Stylosanthes scabra]
MRLEHHLDPSKTPSKDAILAVSGSADSTKEDAVVPKNVDAASIVAAILQDPRLLLNGDRMTFLEYDSSTLFCDIQDSHSESQISTLRNQENMHRGRISCQDSNYFESLTALDYELSDDDHIQVIIDGLNEEYNGFTASVMAWFGTFIVPEAESFLQAYDNMLVVTRTLANHFLWPILLNLFFLPTEEEVDVLVEVMADFNEEDAIFGNRIKPSAKFVAEKDMHLTIAIIGMINSSLLQTILQIHLCRFPIPIPHHHPVSTNLRHM